jgi:ribonuclease P protein component
VLAKAHRLTKASDFWRVRQEGRCWSTSLLVVCARNNDLPVTRSGFAVSKRIGTAVVRNRVKRRMCEAVRLHQDLIAPGWDLVWIARRPIALATYTDIERAVSRLLGVARLLRASAQPAEERAE